jgi:hypothetical protein
LGGGWHDLPGISGFDLQFDASSIQAPPDRCEAFA